MNVHARISDERELYRPTREETRVACETLLRESLPREVRAMIREIHQNTEAEDGTERA